MRGYILAVAVFLCANAQMAPQWGTIECDSSLTDRFPPGSKYQNYNRYYTLTTDYDTIIRRNVVVSTCIATVDNGATMVADIEMISGDVSIRSAQYPYGTTYSRNEYNPDCEEGEHGQTYTFYNIPEGEYEIGVYNGGSSQGGRYKLTVTCPEPSIPSSNTMADNSNITIPFAGLQEWIDGGSKEISCGVSAQTTIVAGETEDYFQYEVTEFAQEVAFTTCYPDDAFSMSDGFYQGTSNLNNYYTYAYYWDFERRNSGGWFNTNSYASGAVCNTITVGDAYNPESGYNIEKLSPGKYYVGIERTSVSGADTDYVLSMLCWNNGAIAAANTARYTAATTTTATPTTPFPTTKSPTSATQTMTPTHSPSRDFVGYYNKPKKANEIGEISCGVHQHDQLMKRHANYYKFEVLTETKVWFDTCMNDITNFESCTELYRWDQAGGQFNAIGSETCDYCNVMYDTLSPDTYYIEIRGKNKNEDFGDYILRMGCGYMQESGITAVSVTDMPTPAPVGVADIPARDGRVVGDISCDLTVEGSTSSQTGDFHKFTVQKGGIDWVKFDTCDQTSFENYLFVYDYVNISGLEHWNYVSYNSIGFHYEDDSTCNELTMNDLVPGTYYVNIDGYNYFFDHGEYTIKMACSDNGAIKGASNYTEYSPGLQWWAILLIVLAILLCCGCIIFGVCYYKKKNEAGGFSGGGNDGESVQMGGKTDDTGGE